MAFFKIIPNITIMAPKDFKELEKMMEFAIKLNKPVVIRYPRGGENKTKFLQDNEITYGKVELLKRGKDVTIIGIGKTVSKAMEIAKELHKYNINAEVINARFLKPLDKTTILKSIFKTHFVVTIEDGTLVGGLASSIKELMVDKKVRKFKIKSFGYPDVFVQHGSPEELEKLYGLDNKNIVKVIREEKKYRKNV